jgi:Ca-activated chloride channel family protein
MYSRCQLHSRLGGLGLLLVFAISAVHAPAQSGRRIPDGARSAASGDDQRAGDDIQLGTQEVLLSVTVRDPEGRPVKGLTKEDFIVAEDRVRQTITSCVESAIPVNVLLLMDASGSVVSELSAIRRAAEGFVDKLGPEDKLSVIQFADKVELIQDWTHDREQVRHALNWRYKGGEATAYWDALYLAAEQLQRVEGRRALIILSDGLDTSSKLSEMDAIAMLDRSNATVFVVSKASSLIARARGYAGFGGVIAGTSRRARAAIDQFTVSEERMRALADRYGGRLFAPIREDELRHVYGQVADELKQQYVIFYESSNERRDRQWRVIEIFTTRPGLTPRTRKGYAAG